MKFLEHDIDDKNFLRYIKRFLKSGVIEGTELKESDRGTPQGGLISPVLANVYLHYVLDLWFEKGTIVFTSDGKNISVDKQPSSYQPPVQTTATTARQLRPPFRRPLLKFSRLEHSTF